MGFATVKRHFERFQILVEEYSFPMPSGWELDEPDARPPKKGEWFYSETHARAVMAQHDYTDNVQMPILRRVWQWPEWLTAKYVAMDSDGAWYAYSEMPVKHSGSARWMPLALRCTYLGNTTFQPPQCDNWQNSLHERPST